MELIWNGIRGVILEGVGNLWEDRCKRNAEQKYTWAELKRVGEEWLWWSKWEEFDSVEEELWTEEIANAEVDELTAGEEEEDGEEDSSIVRKQ